MALGWGSAILITLLDIYSFAGVAQSSVAHHRRRMMARSRKGTHMYKTILVTLDCTATDRAIIEHIKELAKRMQSRVVLLHVATGALAKYHGKNAAGAEVEKARRIWTASGASLSLTAFPADAELAYGEPVKEIVRWVRQKKPDLVAMGTHGHHFRGRSGSRNNGHNGPAQCQCFPFFCSGPDDPEATPVIVYPCDWWTFNKSATNWPFKWMMAARISFRWRNCGGAVRARDARAKRTSWETFTKTLKRF